MSYTQESVGGFEGVPHEMKPLIQHVEKCYHYCLQLERAIGIEERDSDGGQFFPIIVCRRPLASRKLSMESTSDAQQKGLPKRYQQNTEFSLVICLCL